MSQIAQSCLNELTASIITVLKIVERRKGVQSTLISKASSNGLTSFSYSAPQLFYFKKLRANFFYHRVGGGT